MFPARSTDSHSGISPSNGKSNEGSARRRWRPYILASAAAAAAGVALSVSIWFSVSLRENRLAELEFSDRANSDALILQNGINEYIGKIAALRALFQSSDGDVSRRQFGEFSDFLLRNQTAILAVSWIPRITQSQRAAHELAAVSQGLFGYRIHSVGPDGKAAPPLNQNEFFPIFYSSRERPGSPFYGFDLGDNGPRQQTLERARDRDRIATSPNFILKNGAGDRYGFFVVLPIYRPGLPHDTLQDRRSNLVGFVQGAFQIGVLIDTILTATTTPASLGLSFFTADSDSNALPFYFYSSPSGAAPAEARSRTALASGLHWSGDIWVGDSRWQFVAAPIPGGVGTAGHYGAWVLLAAGLFVTAVVVLYILASGRQSLGALRAANEKLLTQNLRFDTALNNMLQGLLMFDAAERLVVCNDRYIEMYGLSREIVKPGCSLRELLQHRAETGHLNRDLEQYRAELLAGAGLGKTTNLILETADGREIAIIVKSMAGGGWVVTHEDITERRRAEAKISHMALHDSLTNLPNRLLFRQQMEDRLAHLGRDDKFAVLYLDLDDFKSINDTLGHTIGDHLLRLAAERLRASLRETDSIARLGGDEFAVLQGSLTQPADTVLLAERLIEIICEPFDLDGQQAKIGVSIGIAIAPSDAADPDQLLKNADLALYRAKADGRGIYRFFEPEMDARMQARRVLELDLRKAIVKGEFELYYQPLVNLQTEQIHGFEALIRWNHPERGLISPADFIPFAEETALIVPIGEWVLRQACAEAAKWPGEVSVAVNLSPAQFKSPTLPLVVINALARSGLAADRLQLEITESVLLSKSEAALKILHELRALGVRISMDDFGTGYSSLSYLRSFPFDKIKIDQSFVRDLSSNTDSMAIIRAITGLGSSLGIATTGEGIETPEELDYLKRQGCTEGQGYLFGKPRPVKDVYALLAEQTLKSEAVA